MEFDFQSTIRVRNNGTAPASWWFVTVPQNISDTIKQEVFWYISKGAQPRKWRWSVRVQVMVGFIKRETSIFPDKKSGCYLLPIKSEIRKELHIKEEWCQLHITLTLI